MPQGIGSELHSFIERCDEVERLSHFKMLVRTVLRPILPHQVAVCGIAELPSYRLLRLINIDFPSGYLKKVIRPDQTIASPEFISWLDEQSPVLIQVRRAETTANVARGGTAPERQIENIAVYGVVDPSATTFSFFAFGNIPGSRFAACGQLLRATVPHLHVALARLLTRPYTKEIKNQATQRHNAARREPGNGNKAFFGTTERERQILQLISGGKTNREIAKLLRISEFTVKTHVKNLLVKLSVTSRSEAVAKAIAARILGGD